MVLETGEDDGENNVNRTKTGDRTNVPTDVKAYAISLARTDGLAEAAGRRRLGQTSRLLNEAEVRAVKGSRRSWSDVDAAEEALKRYGAEKNISKPTMRRLFQEWRLSFRRGEKWQQKDVTSAAPTALADQRGTASRWCCWLEEDRQLRV